MPDNYILDANGAPIGAFRKNQDPSVPTRLHPVPSRNADGDVIIDDETGEPVMLMLPLDDPRVAEELAVTTRDDAPHGMVVEGTVIVGVEPSDTPTE